MLNHIKSSIQKAIVTDGNRKNTVAFLVTWLAFLKVKQLMTDRPEAAERLVSLGGGGGLHRTSSEAHTPLRGWGAFHYSNFPKCLFTVSGGTVINL